MRKHGKNGSLSTNLWTRVSAGASSARKRIQVSCEPGRQSYLWQLDSSSRIIKH
ncbi:MAG TPA: hypothetical protein VNI01_07305 [Elusimicrobiota bacterium]|nr:hypothetical protein [Elusimicrobiota bacterium]